jgi:hypothetical protein
MRKKEALAPLVLTKEGLAETEPASRGATKVLKCVMVCEAEVPS